MIRELVSGSGKIVISPSKSLLTPLVVLTVGDVDTAVLAPDTFAVGAVADELVLVEVLAVVSVLDPWS